MGGTRGDSGKVEYILTKLETRIAKSRTFLVKVKTHRGEPLNEAADDQFFCSSLPVFLGGIDCVI